MSATAHSASPALERYYLETSAHIERWAGEPAVQAAIRSMLGDRTHATSTHVLREWKRVIEGGCAEVLNVLREGKADLSALWARLGSGWGRSPGQSLRVLNLVTGGGPVDATLDMRARRFLRYGSRMLFHRQIDEVRDGSECGLAKNKVFEDVRGRWLLVDRCKKTDKICCQDQFIEVEAVRAEAAAEGLVANAPRTSDKKMGRTMLGMIAKPADRKGKNCYAHTGDISIALECSPDEVLLTTDQSFEAICASLGLQVRRLAATRPPTSSSAGTS